MSKPNLIGIYATSLSTNLSDFAEKGNYKTAVEVICKINDEKPWEMHLNRPIEILRRNMQYRDLESILKNSDGNISAMSIPGKAYRQMQSIVNREVEKVLADMMTSVIVRVIEKLGEKEENIFFIENQGNDKLLGRLGYMYLDNMRNTFCMITYKTSGLLTDTMRNGSQILEFDIDYFKRHEKEQSEVVPRDFMESLLQTVLYRMKTSGEGILPLRCDIFSQGISNKEIQNKVERVHEILSVTNNLTPPFAESTEHGPYARIPYVLYECMEAAERHYKGMLEKILEDADYETNR